MAAALWHGGISFGGVISFIFADLHHAAVAAHLPQVLRQPAHAAAVRVVLRGDGRWPALLVEGIFRLVGARPDRPARDDRDDAASNGTTRRILNIVFLLVFAVLYWLYRNRGRGSAAAPRTRSIRCARCRSRRRTRRRTLVHDGDHVWFCSDRCRDRYESTTVKRLPGDRRSSGDRGGASSRRPGSPRT